MHLFNKILVANRGEIAIRVMRTAKEMGIKTVAIFSSPDKDALFVRTADEAYHVGGMELSDSYLNVEKIIDIAKKCGADAIHPGYGFLSENPGLVAACDREGINFIGPSTSSIKLMGNKIEARTFVKTLGIPMTQGATGTIDQLVEASSKIPYPLLVKAAAGGGGKGMRIVRNPQDLRETIESTSREAKSYFGDGEVYIEQYIEQPRHIEIQVIGDKHGNAIHLYERECSIQRRYQKIIEESPSPTLNQETREKMGKAAAEIARGIGYYSAGTIEFLVDGNLNFYFLEMNTRIQVEHPVTEMVTGIDIVKEQINVALGNPLSIKQEDVKQNGHAIESRIYAEKPEENFRPSPGDMTFYHQPVGNGVRVDAAYDKAATVFSFYDPMISKLVVHAQNRDLAILKSIDSLENYIITAIDTNISYLLGIFKEENYKKNNISTKYCDDFTTQLIDNQIQKKESIDKNLLAALFLTWDLKVKKESSDIWNIIGFWRFLQTLKVCLGEAKIDVQVKKTLENGFVFLIDDNIYNTEIKGINESNAIITSNGDYHKIYFSINHEKHDVVNFQGFAFEVKRFDKLIKQDIYNTEESELTGDSVKSPMPGKVIKINCEIGQEIKKGDVLLIVEAMKMENNILAHRDGTIDEINVNQGDMVDNSVVMVKFVEIT